MWLIVNMTQFDFDDLHHAILPERRKPRYIHYRREAAEDELLRLKRKSPGSRFVLFEAIAEAREIRDFKVFSIVTDEIPF